MIWNLLKIVLATIGILLLVLVLGMVVVPPLTERWTSGWGATDEELAAKLPGDDLVWERGATVRMKAITIAAPADLVYSLIVQMGYQRAGWYGWDWFYNATGSSGFVDGHYSTRVVPELQDLKPGDQIAINKMVGYGVEKAERPKALVLYRCSTPTSMLADPAVAHTEPAFNEESWVWSIQPVDAKHTRLILRIRGFAKGQGAFEKWLFGSPLDLGGAIMGYKTMVGLRNVAEKLTSE